MKDYVKINATYAAAQTGARAVLVIVLLQGVSGWVTADLIASVVVVPAALLAFRYKPTFAFSLDVLRSSLRLGLPLLPHHLSHWALQFADRIVLGSLLTASIVGVYSAGYQFGLVMLTALAEINRAAVPEYGRFLAKDITAQGLASIITIQVSVTLFFGLGVALIAPPVIQIALPQAYAAAASVAPWVALGALFVGIYYVPMNLTAIVAGDTAWIWIATAIAAFANVGLNLLTVRTWGLTAAAVNTAVSYGILLVMVLGYHHVRVRTRICLEWSRLGTSVLVAGGAYSAGAVVTARTSPITDLAVRTGVVCVAGAILLLSLRWTDVAAAHSRRARD